jgi:ABC-type multidrug transport system ATPase subunit
LHGQDDPLSALDAHVGKAVFNNVLLNAPAGKTRILVTHALHSLPQVDYIYTMVDGRLAERGTYAELMGRGDSEFARFVREFGSEEKHEEEEEDRKEDEAEAVEGGDAVEKARREKRKAQHAGKALMQTEERVTGSVSGGVYGQYIKAGDGAVLVPLLLLSLVMIQAATVLSSYW